MFMTALEAFNLVRNGKLSEMKEGDVSEHFTWEEVFTKCTDAEIKAAPLSVYTNASYHAVETMDRIRDQFNRPVIVHDWYRGNRIRDRHGKTHDESAGGTGKGYHPQGLATDFTVMSIPPQQAHDVLNPLPFMQRCGLEDVVYNGIHVDSRGYRARFGPNG